jgi:hypothetical protein
MANDQPMDLLMDRLRHLLTIDTSRLSEKTLLVLRAEGEAEIKEALAQRENVETLERGLELLDMVKGGYTKLSCFLKRVQTASKDPPQLHKFGKKFHELGAEKSTKLRKQGTTIVNKAWVKLWEHLVDGLHKKRVFDRFDCPNCVGDCAVQNAHTSTIRFHEPTTSAVGDTEIIPCVTNETRSLPQYTIRTVRYVSRYPRSFP